MLKFKIFEIPEEKSERSIDLGSEELDLEEISFKSGTLHIEFYRTLHFIRAQFTVDATIELICDRSLDPFDYEVKRDYEVLFRSEKVEESADEKGAVRNFDLSGNQIDLTTDVRDTILLDLPTKKLHPRFLDDEGNPKETVDRQFGDAPQEENPIDPRWEALKELKD